MIRFRKLGLLGSGSYGNVHLAAATSASDDDGDYSILPLSFTAVKSANFYSSSATYLAREKKFLDELVESPFIIRSLGHDVSIEKGKTTYNLMLEYACGGTLRGLIRERGGTGRIGEAEVACYTAMLLQGLSCVHGKGIVHCDMKPDNILVFPLVESNGVLNHHLLKIADFGLAKKVWEEDMIEQPGQESYNRGALLYASPESILLGLHTTANDVWALGCIVFEMLTGQLVWRCPTVKELIAKVVSERPEIPEFVSDIARDFLEKCLDKRLRNRWTIKKLLRHPFIFNNARHFRRTDHLLGSRNPFGFDVSLRRTNTFSEWENMHLHTNNVTFISNSSKKTGDFSQPDVEGRS